MVTALPSGTPSAPSHRLPITGRAASSDWNYVVRTGLSFRFSQSSSSSTSSSKETGGEIEHEDENDDEDDRQSTAPIQVRNLGNVGQSELDAALGRGRQAQRMLDRE